MLEVIHVHWVEGYFEGINGKIQIPTTKETFSALTKEKFETYEGCVEFAVGEESEVLYRHHIVCAERCSVRGSVQDRGWIYSRSISLTSSLPSIALEWESRNKMKHLIFINLWHILHEICLFFNSNAVLDTHWSWKLCPWSAFKWCVKNHGSVNSAKKAILWWHK